MNHRRGLKVPQKRQIPLALSAGEIAVVHDFAIDPQQVFVIPVADDCPDSEVIQMRVLGKELSIRSINFEQLIEVARLKFLKATVFLCK